MYDLIKFKSPSQLSLISFLLKYSLFDFDFIFPLSFIIGTLRN